MVLSLRDQQIYDQGFKFVPQSQYLLNPFVPKEIDMSSQGIAGIQQPLPYPYPTTTTGGDGGGGITTTEPIDPGLMSADDYGMGMEGSMGLSDEDKELLEAYKNPSLTGTQKGILGTMFSTPITGFPLMDPLTGFLGIYAQRKKQQRKAQEAIEEARQREEEARQRAEMETIQREDEARYRSQPGEYGGADRQTEREQAGPGYSGSGTAEEMGSFMNGGLVDLVDIYD
jgi:hypothetical protein